MHTAFFFQVGMFPCTHPGCGMTLKSKQGYQHHMQRHSGIYYYHCPYCNKGFSASKNLKDHLRTQHTGLQGFHCNMCRQEFDTVHKLKQHLDKNSCNQQVINRKNNLIPLTSFWHWMLSIWLSYFVKLYATLIGVCFSQMWWQHVAPYYKRYFCK